MGARILDLLQGGGVCNKKVYIKADLGSPAYLSYNYVYYWWRKVGDSTWTSAGSYHTAGNLRYPEFTSGTLSGYDNTLYAYEWRVTMRVTTGSGDVEPDFLGIMPRTPENCCVTGLTSGSVSLQFKNNDNYFTTSNPNRNTGKLFMWKANSACGAASTTSIPEVDIGAGGTKTITWTGSRTSSNLYFYALYLGNFDNGLGGTYGVSSLFTDGVYVPYAPAAPTITVNNISYSGAKINWSDVVNEDGYYIQVYSGGTWNTINTVAAGTTSYILTGLISSTEYTVRVVSFNGGGEGTSNTVIFSTLVAPPNNPIINNAGVYGTKRGNGFFAGYTISDFATIDETNFYGRISGDTTWILIKTETSFYSSINLFEDLIPVFSADTENNDYEFYIDSVNVSGTGTSNTIVIYKNTTNIDSIIRYDSINKITITTSNINETDYDRIWIWRSYDGINWNLKLSGLITQTEWTDTTYDSSYETVYYAVSNHDTGVPNIYTNRCNITPVENTIAPEAWCSLDTPYTVSGTTSCSNDGEITITNYDVYKYFYSFELFNIGGSQYLNSIYLNETTGAYENLPTNWFRLVATPITSYLRDTCEFKWIELQQDTIIGISGKTLTNAICGSFNQQSGRAIIQFSGLSTPYNNFSVIYNSKGENVSWNGTDTNTSIGENLLPDTYYGYIWDLGAGSSCRLIFSFTIEEEKLYSVPNIKEIYVAEWYDGLDYNYWSTANDPDYYGGLDSLKFQSTKISEFTDTGLTWYYIPVDEPNVSFDQTLSKVRQGFQISDELTIAFSVYDESQWETLKNVLTKRYVVVFRDNNNYLWTFGYRHGAKPSAYTFNSADGGFKFTFSAVSENKIITALAEDYFNNYIK